MEQFLTAIENHKVGSVLILIGIYVIVSLLLKILRTVGWVKNHNKTIEIKAKLNHVISVFILKIVDEFRHLLAAFVIVGFIALSIIVLVVFGKESEKILQILITAFSGILGTIIGFYFGEKKQKGTSDDDENVDTDITPSNTDTPDEVEPVKID